MTESFCDRLKRAIAARAVKQVEVARLGGIDPAYLSMLVNGKRNNPSPDVLAKLASVLRVRKAWLMTGQGKMDASEEEMALNAGSSSSVQDQVAEYFSGGAPSEDQRLRREIMQRLDDASLNADELSREVLKRRVDEFFDAVNRKPKS